MRGSLAAATALMTVVTACTSTTPTRSTPATAGTTTPRARPVAVDRATVIVSYDDAHAGALILGGPRIVVDGDGHFVTWDHLDRDQLVQGTIGTVGVDRLLDEAERDGLLAPPPSYEPDPVATDAVPTHVSLAVSASRFTHDVMIPDQGDSPARLRLRAFLAVLDAQIATASTTPLTPTQWLVVDYASGERPGSCRLADAGGHAPSMTSRPLLPSEVGRPIAELSTECARVS
jgi:hypothetical protein